MAAGEAAGVGAVVVVVVEVVVEVASEAAVADVEEAGEGGPPAFFEDGAVEAFDVAVGLWAAGADLCVGRVGGEALAELAAAELVAVVAEHALESPARSASMCGTGSDSRGGS